MKPILVHVELDSGTHRLGELHTTVRRGQLRSTFSYDRAYVSDPGAYPIEPALPLSAGAWPVDLALPRAFSDAAPDRWGRNLIAKSLRAQADPHGAPRHLDERDFLLGVSDTTRQGALRFSLDVDGPYLAVGTEVPPLITLPALRRASELVARDDPDSLRGVKLLLDAGTGSLGGARPKASVREEDQLFIAKFPHPADEWDVMAWEKTALDLAQAAGVTVPNTQLVDVDGHAVLLLGRFDRTGNRRIGYMSSMTLLGGVDGQNRDYLEIAEALPGIGANPSADLEQLWRRIAFSIAINNTDDHLRNHGFLRHTKGWQLSPAFDLNPNPVMATRVTSIAGAVGVSNEVDELMANAPFFDLAEDQARTIAAEVLDAVAGWEATARRHRIPDREIEQFRGTFVDCTEAMNSVLSRRQGHK